MYLPYWLGNHCVLCYYVRTNNFFFWLCKASLIMTSRFLCQMHIFGCLGTSQDSLIFGKDYFVGKTEWLKKVLQCYYVNGSHFYKLPGMDFTGFVGIFWTFLRSMVSLKLLEWSSPTNSQHLGRFRILGACLQAGRFTYSENEWHGVIISHKTNPAWTYCGMDSIGSCQGKH